MFSTYTRPERQRREGRRKKCKRLTILPILIYSLILFRFLFFSLCLNLSTVLYPHLWWSCSLWSARWIGILVWSLRIVTPIFWANIASKYSPLFSFLQLSKHLERLKRWPDISFPKYTFSQCNLHPQLTKNVASHLDTREYILAKGL